MAVRIKQLSDCGIDYWERDPATNKKRIVDRIELTDRLFNSQSFDVEFNGKESDKCPTATPTSLSIRIRKLLTIRAKNRRRL